MRVASIVLGFLIFTSTVLSSDLQVTIPTDDPTSPPVIVGRPVDGGTPYTTFFNMIESYSGKVYVNLTAKSLMHNPKYYSNLHYKIEDSNNNIITYGMFDSYEYHCYTPLSAYSFGNFTAGRYSITFTSEGTGQTFYKILTHRGADAVVSQVPEPSTVLMGILGAGTIFLLTKKR